MKIDVASLPTFYINLDEKTERKDQTEKILKDLGFVNFERFPAVKAEGRSIGCSTSHANALRHIINNNIYPALILEDDIGVFDFKNSIDVPDKADAMYIGFSRYGYNHNQEEPHPRSLKIKELSENNHRVHNMLARHAVIHFSKDYGTSCVNAMEDFLNNPSKHVAGDIALAKIHPENRVYCQNVPLFYQNDMKTRSLTKTSLFDCSYVEMDKI